MVKQGRGAIRFVFLVAFFSFVSATAQAQTILHVNRTDPTCAGQSPCFATIQAALDGAGPNTVIRIQAGTYPERLSIAGKNNFQGATEVDRIIIEADPAAQPGAGGADRRSGHLHGELCDPLAAIQVYYDSRPDHRRHRRSSDLPARRHQSEPGHPYRAQPYLR